MEELFLQRLEALRRPWCRADLVAELLGVDLTSDARLSFALRSWSNRFQNNTEVERASGRGPEINRHALETFLAQNGLISWKWAGVYLGMSEETLSKVVELLEGKGVSPQLRSLVSDQLVRQREAAQLYRAFPSLRSRNFSDHSRMCRALHQAIEADLRVQVAPLTCVTSKILDAEPDIAAAFDAITFEPVGLRYQVWLDTNKPVNLRPDVCSLKLYAQNEDDLRAYLMRGAAPEQIDDRLRAA